MRCRVFQKAAWERDFYRQIYTKNVLIKDRQKTEFDVDSVTHFTLLSHIIICEALIIYSSYLISFYENQVKEDHSYLIYHLIYFTGLPHKFILLFLVLLFFFNILSDNARHTFRNSFCFFLSLKSIFIFIFLFYIYVLNICYSNFTTYSWVRYSLTTTFISGLCLSIMPTQKHFSIRVYLRGKADFKRGFYKISKLALNTTLNRWWYYIYIS